MRTLPITEYREWSSIPEISLASTTAPGVEDSLNIERLLFSHCIADC